MVSLRSRLLVIATMATAFVASGAARSSADENLVVFSATSGLLANVAYDPVELGISPDPPGGRTIRHLVIGLYQGEYTVTYGGDNIVCSSPPFYCYSPEDAIPAGQAPNSLVFTSCVPIIDDGREFEITRVGDLDLPDSPVIIEPVSNGQHYPSWPADVLLSGTCEQDVDEITISVNGKVSGTDIPDGSPSVNWSYTCTLTEDWNTIMVTATRDGLTSVPAIIHVTYLDAPEDPEDPEDTLVITTDGGNGPGENFFTNVPSLALTGTCTSMTDSIAVDLVNASGSSSSAEGHAVGTTTWSYSPSGSTESAPIEAVAFQDEGTPVANALPGVSVLDNIWSPEDIIPTGTVTSRFYANGPSDAYFDALSLVFEPEDMDPTNLALRIYLQKGTAHVVLEHYQLLPGTFNSEDEDEYYFVYVPADNRDHMPNGQLAPGTEVGWIELPFDATSDLLFDEPGGNIGVTLRMWNWRVNSVRLLERTVLLREGENHFTVTGEDIWGVESSDEIVITLDVQAPEVAITSNGGQGPGNDFSSLNRNVTIGGTFQDNWNVTAIEVNGSSSGVSRSIGFGTWSYETELGEQGPNTFVVTARDAAGNVSEVDSVTISFERAAPILHGAPATSLFGILVLCAAVIGSMMVAHTKRKIPSV